MKKESTIGIVALVGVIVMLSFYLALNSHIFALDDAYIHLTYARNIIAGHPFQYNIGEFSSGTTSPLWTTLLAVTGAVVGLIGAGFLLPMLFFILTGIISYLLMLRLTGDDFLSAAAGVTILFTGRFAWSAFTALETTAFTFTGILTLYLYLGRNRRAGEAYACALAGLSIFLRPEALVLIGLLAGHLIYTRRKNIWFNFALLVLPVIGYFILNIALDGTIFPATYYTKKALALTPSASFGYLSYQLRLLWGDNPIIFIAGVAGVLLWFIKWRKINIFPLVWFVSLFILKVLFVPTTGHLGRYLLPVLPMFITAAFIAVHILVPSRVSLIRWMVLLPLFYGGIFLFQWAKLTDRMSRQIETTQIAAADWLEEHSSSDACIATHEAGAIAYYTHKKKIIDLAGLTYPPLAKALREQPSLSLHSVEGGELLYKAIKKEHSEYLAVYPEMVPTLIARLGGGAHLEAITKPIINPVESMPYLWIYKIEWNKVPETFGDYPPLPVIMLSIAVPVEKKAFADGINEDSLRYRLRKDIELMGFQLGVIGKWLNRKARTAPPESIAAIADEACFIFPDVAVFWNTAGAIHSTGGDFEKAAYSFTKAIELSRDNTAYKTNLAVALLRSGEQEKAASLSREILEKEPDNKVALQILDAAKGYRSGQANKHGEASSP